MPDRPAFARLGLAKADVRHTAWPCLLLAGVAEAPGHRQREAGQAHLLPWAGCILSPNTRGSRRIAGSTLSNCPTT